MNVDVSLAKHLGQEIKDETQLEIVTEMVAEWIHAQGQKYMYFDDEDPCRCGDSGSTWARPQLAVESLADDIKRDRVVPWHRTGDCVGDDDDDEEDEDKD